MTYCVGILVDQGFIMMADTRTNAGIDNIATFRKLHLSSGRANSMPRSPPPATCRSPSRCCRT